MEYKRLLDLNALLQKKSFFLFGPRSTGKTYLIRSQLESRACVVNLLRTDLLLRLTAEPWRLEEIISSSGRKLVVIDEVQKVPMLLDEVHRLIEDQGIRFLLTGSSARRLKGRNTNLLAGRAWQSRLFPLVSAEIPRFDIERYLTVGGLPQVYGSDSPHEELDAYVSTYLTEEVKGEGVVRDLPRFSRLLKVAALCSGTVINFTQLASDVGCSPSTAIEHFRILEDTLIGFMLEPWGRSHKRKEVSSAKFYLFDTGVTNVLAEARSLPRESDLFGRAFEQFIVLELRAALSYRRMKERMCFWRTYDKREVDLVIDDRVAIEVKAGRKMSDRDAKNLLLLREEAKFKELMVVSFDKVERIHDGVRFLHHSTFLRELWEGTLLC